MNKCSECGSQNISVESSGEQVCRECGLVLEETGIEQPFITKAIEKQATIPYLVSAGSKVREGRIYKAVWMLSTREKNLQAGMQKIEHVSSKLNLPNFVIKESQLIFKKALYSNIGIGRNNISLVYASIYLACNLQGIPKTPLELTAHSEIENKHLMKAFKLIKNKLKIQTKLIDPIDLLQRFASKLELKPETIRLAAEILMRIKGTSITAGRRSETILAGTIYVAGKQNNDARTQRQIANTLGVIENTIRKISKEIIKVLN